MQVPPDEAALRAGEGDYGTPRGGELVPGVDIRHRCSFAEGLAFSVRCLGCPVLGAGNSSARRSRYRRHLVGLRANLHHVVSRSASNKANKANKGTETAQEE
jgi:hypothetical protein